jgi:hypothetical protein
VGRRGQPPGRPWSRTTRQQVIDTLLRDAMIEIRALAYTPDMASHPDGHLVEIGLISDVCHNLPGAAEPQPVGEYDALVWTWQTANQFQKSWLRSHLNRTGVDLSFLELAPKLPRPATAPDTRPHWRAWQWPRYPGAFVAADSATLSDLIRGARAAQTPDPQFGPAREAFIESMLRHLHPDSRHILRRSRPDETQFVPDGPGDLRQYRAVLTMCDNAVIVDHPRLRTSDVDILPANLSLIRRLQLAAVPRRTGERDAGLWMRAHREANPDCPLCVRPAEG